MVEVQVRYPEKNTGQPRRDSRIFWLLKDGTHYSIGLKSNVKVTGFMNVRRQRG